MQFWRCELPLRFRNFDVTPEDPVEKWGVEGLVIVIDRGSLVDRRRDSAGSQSAATASRPPSV